MSKLSNKVYSIVLVNALAPAANYNVDLLLSYLRHSFKLKSIGFYYSLSIVGTLNYLPNYDRGLFFIRLCIGRGLVDQPKISDTFATAAAWTFNGSRMELYYPGQIFFDSWFINEQIELLFESSNSDLINSYNLRTTIIAEIEPL